MKRLIARLKRSIFRPAVDPATVSEAQRTQRFRDFAHQADVARDGRDWPTAAAAYEAALAIDGEQTAIRVQHGHALKELGRFADAEAAYRRATIERPDDADACLQLAHVLKMQRRLPEALDAYVEALRRDPMLIVARDELIAAGGRDRLDDDVFGRSGIAANLANLSITLDAAMSQVREAMTVSAFPLVAYDAFRRQYAVLPAPTDAGPVIVVVQAVGVSPARLRHTLTSLMDQRMRHWCAVVVADANVLAHTVSSLALLDPRFSFIDFDRETIDAGLDAASTAPLVYLAAGAVLDPEALGWLTYGLARTGAAAMYADHDHFQIDWRKGPIRQHPVLQSMADRHDMEQSQHPPAALIVTAAHRLIVLDLMALPLSDIERRRLAVLRAIKAGPVAHLPCILSSLPFEEVPSAQSRCEAAPVDPASRILVVIPTRDEPDMLERCIGTLKARASHPERLDILVVDNRSEDVETSSLLTRLKAEGQIETSVMDEPFNWARLNNEAAKGGEQSVLVFLNNDTEMVTEGWDNHLLAWLFQSDIGVVGARLLYPDETLQHGGILLGSWENRPVHDGLGAAVSDGGPLGRWRRSRAAAAVTGAFMACRRDVFEQVGGFDARLAIAYNDIDFCLKVRAAGMQVLYAANIELLHHESKTRGHNDRPEKVAWDDAELADLHRRWGDDLFLDPGLNPHWASARLRPYDGYRAPPLSVILEHLERSARPRPWAIDGEPHRSV